MGIVPMRPVIFCVPLVTAATTAGFRQQVTCRHNNRARRLSRADRRRQPKLPGGQFRFPKSQTPTMPALASASATVILLIIEYLWRPVEPARSGSFAPSRHNDERLRAMIHDTRQFPVIGAAGRHISGLGGGAIQSGSLVPPIQRRARLGFEPTDVRNRNYRRPIWRRASHRSSRPGKERSDAIASNRSRTREHGGR
jgi:hypothetical protein